MHRLDHSESDWRPSLFTVILTVTGIDAAIVDAAHIRLPVPYPNEPYNVGFLSWCSLSTLSKLYLTAYMFASQDAINAGGGLCEDQLPSTANDVTETEPVRTVRRDGCRGYKDG